MSDYYRHQLRRVAMTPKAKLTHLAHVDRGGVTLCGRTAVRPLIDVDSLDWRSECDHCLRVKDDAGRGDPYNLNRASIERVVARKIDNGCMRR